ncbi:helix-turn-helix transcriptional regulator [Streptomyces phaeochromogenes]|uniref:helix-turn-helix domain-containing protein n=1 Tax=Streptomyces phaeochromogenes TaxID=1923 RepID=UPI002DD819C6|nr:helix-turn-helix transcriptional regulator [Streptomyces phaeochromogenes]WRZ28064.1 helix-turn-helix domain-containing protein [Streptomyces phaeochromogenes]
MTGGRARTAPPRSYAVDPDKWPDARIVGEPAAAVVQTIARRLATALGERPDLSLRALATQSDVGRQTIGDLLAGAGWPDVLTVCRLERALGLALWPGSNTTQCAHG